MWAVKMFLLYNTVEILFDTFCNNSSSRWDKTSVFSYVYLLHTHSYAAFTIFLMRSWPLSILYFIFTLSCIWKASMRCESNSTQRALKILSILRGFIYWIDVIKFCKICKIFQRLSSLSISFKLNGRRL